MISQIRLSAIVASLAGLVIASSAIAEEPRVQAAAAKAEANKLAGVWLADSAMADGTSMLSRVWDSKITIKENSFALSRLMTHPKDLTGSFNLDLVSGKLVDDGNGDSARGRTSLQFGVVSYPTAILIDPDGKVVGRWGAPTAKEAIAKAEKLLNGKK